MVGSLRVVWYPAQTNGRCNLGCDILSKKVPVKWGTPVVELVQGVKFETEARGCQGTTAEI
ncbi:hypothetical protein ARMSODRAFT_952003 [Armillaria solidipes]|uniref:Uncharacterized protein n=1 Tax=Armillaria solidipes TaxID=1076256 RepID=A0A2H3BU62_9AGAR|nr:hypothetical protein ARMSODRAFT_952003 [Armillaria solidipes]